jgi:uncharacterized RDD family membrane protein YckC
VLFAYFSAFWLRSGQTLAMKTWRVRLVRTDGQQLTIGLVALRFALAGLIPVTALIGYWLTRTNVWPWTWMFAASLGFVWALFDRDQQFLHDRIVGTRLIRVPRKA